MRAAAAAAAAAAAVVSCRTKPSLRTGGAALLNETKKKHPAGQGAQKENEGLGPKACHNQGLPALASTAALRDADASKAPVAVRLQRRAFQCKGPCERKKSSPRAQA